MWQRRRTIARQHGGFLYQRSCLGTGGKLRPAESGRRHIGTRELSAGVHLHETDDASVELGQNPLVYNELKSS